MRAARYRLSPDGTLTRGKRVVTTGLVYYRDAVEAIGAGLTLSHPRLISLRVGFSNSNGGWRMRLLVDTTASGRLYISHSAIGREPWQEGY